VTRDWRDLAFDFLRELLARQLPAGAPAALVDEVLTNVRAHFSGEPPSHFELKSFAQESLHKAIRRARARS